MGRDKGKEPKAAQEKSKKVAEPKKKKVPMAKPRQRKPQQEPEPDPAEEETVEATEGIASGSSSAPAKKKAQTKYKYNDYHKALKAMEWVPTKFPDVELLHRMGIYDDVWMIMTNMGIANLLGMRHRHSQPESCQFLASLEAVFYDSSQYTEEHGTGLIKFKVQGKSFEMGFKELNAIFGFPEGIDSHFTNHKYETGAFWNEIGCGTHTPGAIANSGIRHPATRYVHRILAETFYGRPELSKVKENELKFLTIGFRPLFGGVFNNGREILTGRNQGDLNVVGLFVKRLLELKEWGCNHRDKEPLVRLGGMITPILRARPITLTPTTTDIFGDLIDEFYLQKTGYLEGKCGDMYAYRYKEFNGEFIKVLLPAPALTSLAHRNNITFDLTGSPYCYNPTRHGVLQLITLESMKTSRNERAERRAERAEVREEEQQDEPIYGGARYHFSPHNRALPNGPLQEAHKKIETLQRWNKWQDRSLRKMSAGYEKMAKGYDKMKKQIKHLTRLLGSGNKQHKRASHHDEEAGSSAPSHFRRSASCDLDGLEAPPQLHRSATTGRRQRRKMKTPSPPVSDNESLDFTMDFSPEPSCSPPHYHF